MPEVKIEGVEGFTQDGMSPEGSEEQANKGISEESEKEENKE